MRLAVTIALVAAGCVDPLTTRPVNTPQWEAENVRGYAETAGGQAPDKVLGWDLVVVGDVARWRECTSVDRCGNIERSCATRDLLGVERVGQATVDREPIDVLRLSLVARPKYVVPYAKAPPR